MSVAVQQSNVFFAETTTNLGASAAYTGPARSAGADAGENCRYSAFNAFATAGVAGTLRVEMSANGTTWYRAAADAAVAANAAVTLSVPVTQRFYRVVYTNGAGAQTGTLFMATSSFTSA
jgi:hypothetical protein